MILTFELRFHSSPGQQLFISGDHDLLGQGDIQRAIPMRYKDAQRWDVMVWLPDVCVPNETLTYDYVLKEPDGTLFRDWGANRRLKIADLGHSPVTIIDAWNYAGFHENAFLTEPFQEVLLSWKCARFAGVAAPHATHRFSVRAPLLGDNESLCLLGGGPGLNSWDTRKPLLLSRSPENSELSADVRLAPEDFPLQYKYGVFDFAQNRLVRFEGGENRVLPEPPSRDGELVFVRDGFAVLPSTAWKGAGVAIPVFSLRSERSFGIGEFRDLQLLTDWCATTGLKLIQLLPINDTIATQTWKDSYPYSGISAFALNPIYLCLEQVAMTTESRQRLRSLEEERAGLNSLPDLDFETVLRIKLKFLQAVFDTEKEGVLTSVEFQQFFQENSRWLLPYAVFCGLRDKYGTTDFTTWPTHKQIDSHGMEELATGELREAVEFAFFTQFHLHLQLKAAVDYAHQRGVILKGDIPIGVFRYGADAWQQPQEFHMEMQAGAPPDAFAENGQNWEFPTYNWPQMEKDGYSWWKMRFRQMSRYFDAFRIDHILGFFRIWSIPRHAVQGILGYFVPARPVRREEFEALGIVFEHERFVLPQITDRLLNDLFGPEAEPISLQFLEPDGPGKYRLKGQFNTQRKILEFFGQELDEKKCLVRDKLFQIVADVLLLEEEGNPGAYHFRFAIEGTTVYREMPPAIQARLKSLYQDYFFHRQDEFWMRESLKRLPAMKRSTDMLICGEDLGMVPACVPKVMRDLGLLSLEIQRMPKDSKKAFFRPAEAPYLSVVSPSTHDMSTIRGWWEEDPEITQRFYTEELHLPGLAPKECTADICELIVRQHLNSSAMWSIFQLQDLLGTDQALRRSNPHEERINVPANPENRWRYRMHLTLEQLLGAHESNERLRRAVVQGGRAAIKA